jgi:methanogenic corrinoid protein MtbC1
MTDQKIRPAVSANQSFALLKTIEGEVIPRLILAHRRQGLRYRDDVDSDAGSESNRSSTQLSAAQVEQLCVMLSAGHDAEALAYMHELQSLGVDRNTLYLDLLAPAARWFGVAWENESADFVEVTVGVRRLQKLARGLAEEAGGSPQLPLAGRRALIGVLPGEQHVFGSQIVVHMLRQARWDVWDAPGATETDILSFIQNEWFAVVGLSISSFEQIDALSGLIRQIRRLSLNRDVRIMVGGLPFYERADSVALAGADVAAIDGRDAVRRAEQLIQLL